VTAIDCYSLLQLAKKILASRTGVSLTRMSMHMSTPQSAV